MRTVPVDAAALDHAVNVRVVSEHEGALHEEDDGERVEGRDERDGQEVLPAALPAAPDPVANHGAGGPVGGHLWPATSKR